MPCFVLEQPRASARLGCPKTLHANHLIIDTSRSSVSISLGGLTCAESLTQKNHKEPVIDDREALRQTKFMQLKCFYSLQSAAVSLRCLFLLSKPSLIIYEATFLCEQALLSSVGHVFKHMHLHPKNHLNTTGWGPVGVFPPKPFDLNMGLSSAKSESRRDHRVGVV